ncbi:MAG TPA: hypothetical protein VJ886_04055 [Roseovarius sp.]|nr:hypothetical protein [Roseovarius sp.]
MSASTLAFVILTPFVGIFAYAAWHEWQRARDEGPGTYGLAYDPETDSTHVTLLEEGETGYDPESESSADDAGEEGEEEAHRNA